MRDPEGVVIPDFMRYWLRFYVYQPPVRRRLRRTSIGAAGKRTRASHKLHERRAP